MYSEADKPVDSDIISIDIKNKDVQFEYRTEPTLSDYFSQAMLMMFIPGFSMFFLGSFIVLILEIINSYLLGDIFLFLNYSYKPIAASLGLFVIAFPVLFTIWITLLDYFLKTKTISALHKSIYLFSEKHNITPGLAQRQYVFIKAKKQVETIRIPSPSVGFLWESSGEHRKYLDNIVFHHEKVCDFPRKIKTWIPMGFSTGLAFRTRPEALLKLYFSKLPTNGRIKFTVY